MISNKFSPEDLECLVRSAAELWDNTFLGKADEYLPLRQKGVLERASAALQLDFEGELHTLPDRSRIEDAL